MPVIHPGGGETYFSLRQKQLSFNEGGRAPLTLHICWALKGWMFYIAVYYWPTKQWGRFVIGRHNWPGEWRETDEIPISSD